MSTALQQISDSFGLEEQQRTEVLEKLNLNPLESLQEIEDISKDYYSRNLAALSLVMANNNEIENYNKAYIHNAIDKIDQLIHAQLNAIITHREFKELHNEWLNIQEIFNAQSEHDKVEVCLLEVSKEELQYDFERNLYDISSSDLFRKVYVDEFDQFGGEPYGLLLGMYDFNYQQPDITWLSGMGMLAEAAHAPFIGSIDFDFFGVESAAELRKIKSFESLLTHPRYRLWNEFRKTDQAAYVGLTVGKYVSKQPYHPTNNPVFTPSLKGFTEYVENYEDDGAYLWTPASVLFAKNVMRSYEKTGWMQYIRGPENGGYIENLLAPIYNMRGFDEQKSALNVSLADYMELSLANIGVIPIIEEKGTNNACFFSVQSIKSSEDFIDEMDAINSQLVTNLSYTLCVSRIAHYIKCVIREKIGSIVDKETIFNLLNDWISNYVTTAFQPTPLEMAKYPFRAANIEVNPIPGKAGWYKTQITVLPHIQFEGMDTTLKIDARLDPGLFGAE